MMLQVDARKVQVLLTVLQRAPLTVAEQLVCEEVAALLVQLVEGQIATPAPEGVQEHVTQPE
jgi:hypothetical protein